MTPMPRPLRNTCRVLAALCFVAIPANLFLPALVWLFPELSVAFIDSLPPELPSDPAVLNAVPLAGKLGAYSAFALPAAILCFGFWRLAAMFQSFARGDVFSDTPISNLRAFALTLLLHSLLQPIAGAVASVFSTFHLGVGNRALTISVGSSDILALGLGALFLVLSWVLLEAVRIAQENREFV